MLQYELLCCIYLIVVVFVFVADAVVCYLFLLLSFFAPDQYATL